VTEAAKADLSYYTAFERKFMAAAGGTAVVYIAVAPPQLTGDAAPTTAPGRSVNYHSV
jgi:hypothetical protein